MNLNGHSKFFKTNQIARLKSKYRNVLKCKKRKRKIGIKNLWINQKIILIKKLFCCLGKIYANLNIKIEEKNSRRTNVY